MGYLRFFRRKKIGPGLSLNLSKSGPSLSFGPRGAKMTVGPRGIRRTVGIPGTGAYYVSTGHRSSARRSARSSSPTAGDTALGLLVVLVIGLALVVAFWQYVLLIGIGAFGIGLMWWALHRDRGEVAEPVDATALTELGDLRAKGLLTDAEFEQKKAAIRGSISGR